MSRLSTPLRFGLYAIIFGTVFSIVQTAIINPMRSAEAYRLAEIFGYAGIFLSLLIVLVGQGRARLEAAASPQAWSFGRAFKVGLIISAIAGLGFAIYSLIFFLVVPNFMETAQAFELELNPNAFDGMSETDMALYKNPGIGALVMFFTVFVPGLVYALVGAVIFRTPPAPATAA